MTQQEQEMTEMQVENRYLEAAANELIQEHGLNPEDFEPEVWESLVDYYQALRAEGGDLDEFFLNMNIETAAGPLVQPGAGGDPLELGADPVSLNGLLGVDPSQSGTPGSTRDGNKGQTSDKQDIDEGGPENPVHPVVPVPPVPPIELFGTPGNDSILGGDGPEIIMPNAGNDTVDGAGGNDRVDMETYLTFRDDLDGGSGDDTLSYTFTSGSTKDLNNTTGFEHIELGDVTTKIKTVDNLVDAGATLEVDGSLLTGSHKLTFDGRAETDGSFDVVSGTGKDVLRGGQQGDRFVSGDGNDKIYGGDGNDSMTAGEGNDLLLGEAGNDTLMGGAGTDKLTGGTGSDIIDGGGGTDTAYYTASTAGVNVNLTTGNGSGGDAEGDTITGVERLQGSDHADTLTGDANANYLYGHDGNDILSGEGGVDRLYGGDGDDSMSGGDGNDRLDANDGNDTLRGGDGNDKLYGHSGADEIFGDDGKDKLYGGDGNDSLFGGEGKDSLYGHDGNDVLEGGDGNDYLRGYDGDDYFLGGAGADTLVGNSGNDTFRYDSLNEGGDKISKFVSGEDGFEFDASEFDATADFSSSVIKGYDGTNGNLGHTDASFVFDEKTGDLWYDINGDDVGGETLIADVSGDDVVDTDISVL
ncbi:MAG: hypothetical protein OCC46_16110 [Pseudodesulfovibrio sp.]